MPQEHRQRLFDAFKAWLLCEVGVTQAINDSKEEIMTQFSRYQAAVNTTLTNILTTSVEVSAAIGRLVEATKAQDEQQVNEAIASLAAKQQQIVDAVTGIISTVPSPTAATPVPPVENGQIPQLVVPEVPSAPVVDSAQSEDPEVPVTVEPSPDGVGVDGGSNIDSSSSVSE